MRNDFNSMVDKALISPDEYSRINCAIVESDFSTNYPSQSRIERTAREINEYLNYKRRHMEV